MKEIKAKRGTWSMASLRIFMSIVVGVSSSQGYSAGVQPVLVKKSWALVGHYGIQAPKAWEALKGACANVTVAVIDTGVDFSHPDLKNSRWENVKELNGKPGVDDDGNGLVDDIYGYDFVVGTGKANVDENGHGSHIAGIIAADGENGNGIRGVCPGAKIMSLRYHGPKVTGVEALQYTVKAIKYAVKNGARIINYSGGGRYYSAEEFAAMKEAEAAGVLVVAASGNETSNVDQEENHYYPASYGLSNIVSVAGIDPTGEKVKSSNWGLSVDLAAPGKDILSTSKDGAYQMLTGTSQATAFVSGTAALILASNPKLDYMKVKSILVDSGLKTSTLVGKVRTGVRLDAYAAVVMAQKTLTPKKSHLKVRSLAKKSHNPLRSTATWQLLSEKKSKARIHPALNQ